MSKLYTKLAAQCTFSNSSISHLRSGRRDTFQGKSNETGRFALSPVKALFDILMYHANDRIYFTIDMDIKSLSNHIFAAS